MFEYHTLDTMSFAQLLWEHDCPFNGRPCLSSPSSPKEPHSTFRNQFKQHVFYTTSLAMKLLVLFLLYGSHLSASSTSTISLYVIPQEIKATQKLFLELKYLSTFSCIRFYSSHDNSF